MNQKVGAPWGEETDWAIPNQFVGGFQELMEVSEISSCGAAYPEWDVWVPFCVKNKLHRGKVFCTTDVHVDEPQHAELKVDGEMIPKGEDLIQVTDIS